MLDVAMKTIQDQYIYMSSATSSRILTSENYTLHREPFPKATAVTTSPLQQKRSIYPASRHQTSNHRLNCHLADSPANQPTTYHDLEQHRRRSVNTVHKGSHEFSRENNPDPTTVLRSPRTASATRKLARIAPRLIQLQSSASYASPISTMARGLDSG